MLASSTVEAALEDSASESSEENQAGNASPRSGSPFPGAETPTAGVGGAGPAGPGGPDEELFAVALGTRAAVERTVRAWALPASAQAVRGSS